MKQCKTKVARRSLFRNIAGAGLLWTAGRTKDTGACQRPDRDRPAGRPRRCGRCDILKHLAPLRKARIWIPAETPAGATDVRIHRVMITGGRPAAVEIRAGHTE